MPPKKAPSKPEPQDEPYSVDARLAALEAEVKHIKQVVATALGISV